jgi:hypothetical protein
MVQHTDGMADAAIKKLWSSSESERKDGMNEVLSIGPTSIEPLLQLLTDLIRDQRPRFASGTEEEGSHALKEYLRVEREFENGKCTYDEMRTVRSRLSTLTINSSLMTGVVYLLGELKAERAVPALIEIMNRHWDMTPNGPEIPSPETAALRKIGTAAVPQLNQNLEDPAPRACNFEPLVYDWRIADEEDDSSDLDEGDAECREQIGLIRHRVVWLLGEIGDPEALPALERLLATIKSSPDSAVFGIGNSVGDAIEEAVRKIQKTGRYASETSLDPNLPKLVPK